MNAADFSRQTSNASADASVSSASVERQQIVMTQHIQVASAPACDGVNKQVPTVNKVAQTYIVYRVT